MGDGEGTLGRGATRKGRVCPIDPIPADRRVIKEVNHLDGFSSRAVMKKLLAGIASAVLLAGCGPQGGTGGDTGGRSGAGSEEGTGAQGGTGRGGTRTSEGGGTGGTGTQSGGRAGGTNHMGNPSGGR